MRGIVAICSALLITLVTLAPSLALLDFHIHRSYIERELCMQRDLAEGMRTCHGECQLSKRLKALEQEAERGFPAEELQFREIPMVVEPMASAMPDQASVDAELVFWARVMTADGHARSSEHVPWG